MLIIFHKGKKAAKILPTERRQVKCHSVLNYLPVGEVLDSEVFLLGIEKKGVKRKRTDCLQSQQNPESLQERK